MRILHTSDWHLGHTLHDIGRQFEHQGFLTWLVEQLQARSIDALLIPGDVFDTANPSAASQDLWFRFLAQAVRARPGLQIVATAGNHDSGARLEAPDHLLRQFDIRVLGSLRRRADGTVDPEGLLVPLKDAAGEARAVVIAMPFLRAGDLPPAQGEDPLVEGVRQLYAQALEAARPLGLPVIAMGHCYLVAGQVSELSERKVLGGNQHAIPLELFPPEVVYVALGHLHLPQSLASGRIRYCGSPIPLSMSERHYPHSVTVVDLDPDGSLRQEHLRIPRSVELVRIPDQDFLPREELSALLAQLPEAEEEAQGRPKAFLELAVRLDRPETGLRPGFEALLDGKGFFLAKITPQYTGTGRALGDGAPIHGLRDLAVDEVFLRKWGRDYRTEPSPEHLSALHELIDQLGQEAPAPRRA